MHASYNVLIEVDDNVSLIVGDPQGILDLQLWSRPIYLLNIVILHKWCEQSRCSEVKGIKGHKIFKRKFRIVFHPYGCRHLWQLKLTVYYQVLSTKFFDHCKISSRTHSYLCLVITTTQTY